MRRVILAAAFAAAAFSLALSPASAASRNGGTNSADGVDDLGIDISSVLLTTSSVKMFISSLSPDARRGVEGGCVTYNRFPSGVDSDTLAFCKLAI